MLITNSTKVLFRN